MERRKISITPHMLRAAVRELQKRQLYVKLENLKDFIRRHYPVERNFKIFEQELQEKLNYAVCVGLLVKHEDDQYCIPTLREEAHNSNTAISAFREMYKNRNRLCNVTKKKKADVKRSIPPRKRKDCASSNTDETDSSEDL